MVKLFGTRRGECSMASSDTLYEYCCDVAADGGECTCRAVEEVGPPIVRIDLTTFSSVWIDKDRMSGAPCLQGTRFPVAQLLAEVLDSNVPAVAADFDLDENTCNRFLEELIKALEG